MKKSTLYIDMDGVVADFDQAVIDTLKPDKLTITQAKNNHRWDPSIWKQITQNTHFYRTLPKMPKADQLIALARKFRDRLGWNLYMLTAIPKDNDMPDCIQDKILWMQQYYPDIPVRFGPYAKDKQRHTQPGDILIDDKTSNIEEWRQQKGIAIHVTKDYDVALLLLEKYYNLYERQA